MRDIKFRAWDGNKLRMAFGWGDKQTNNLFYREFLNEFHDKWMYGLDCESVILDQCIGCDYDIEIFENDIIDIDYGDTIIRGVVIYDNDACFKLSTGFDTYSLDNYSSIKLIGNIHENPELLEQQK